MSSRSSFGDPRGLENSNDHRGRSDEGRGPVKGMRRRLKTAMEAQIWGSVANYEISVTSPGLSDFQKRLQREPEQEPSGGQSEV